MTEISSIAELLRFLGGGVLAALILWLFRDLVKEWRQAVPQNGGGRSLAIIENVAARLISMDVEHRAVHDAELEAMKELTRQGRETADLLRARHEREATSRAEMKGASDTIRRDLADLAKMMQKMIDRDYQ